MLGNSDGFLHLKTNKKIISFPENSPFKAFLDLLISWKSKNKQNQFELITTGGH